MSNSSGFKLRSQVLRSSADLQLYDSKFQTEGALSPKAFADNASVIRGAESSNLFGQFARILTIHCTTRPLQTLTSTYKTARISKGTAQNFRGLCHQQLIDNIAVATDYAPVDV